MRKRVLPICTKPSICAYAHHSYLHCILESYENIGDELLRMYIPNAGDYEWEYMGKNIRTSWMKDVISLSCDKYEENTEFYMMRKCNMVDEIIIEVQFHQFTNSSSVINVVLCSDNIDKCIKEDNSIIRIGLLRKRGIYVKVNDQYVIAKDQVLLEDYPIWFKIRKDDNQIYALVSYDNLNWIELYSTNINDTKNLSLTKIGVNTNNGVNQYYSWLFLNYIQLYYNNVNAYVWLDYYNLPERNYRKYHLNHFFDFNKDYYYEMEQMMTDINTYIHWSINNGYYIEIQLDDYYIPSRDRYCSEHRKHNNLIYGYDDERNEYNLIGYNNKLHNSMIAYADFERAFKAISNDGDIIYRIKYAPSDQTFEFNKNILKEKLQEYMEGIDSSEAFATTVPLQEGIYGIKVYDVLINTERGKYLLLQDKRISYVLYEHNKIMKDRIDYLISKKIISDDYTTKKLILLINEIVNKSETLKNSILKKNMVENISDNHKNRLENTIISITKELYKIETQFYEELIILL